ncbi:MAG TPA: hypothetical protein VF173_27435 [Thermoanaerobaculia bacterium]|nr:hypothetical protein [Thermoanaerobaculia bacterium]
MNTDRKPDGFWKTLLKIILPVLFLTALLVALLVERRLHPRVVIPEENRHRFARVGVLIDGTPSIHDDNFAVMKKIVQEKIIPNLGLSDIVLGFDVEPGFSFQQDRVLGSLDDSDQPPQLSKQLRSKVLVAIDPKGSDKGAARNKVYEVIRDLKPCQQLMRELRNRWSQRVAALQPKREKGSDICDPLRELARFLPAGDEPSAERWLFILSDLQNETPGKTSGETCSTEQPFPPGTQIIVIYPWGPNDPKARAASAFWQDLFAGQPVKSFSFSALPGTTLLRPNPTAGLESTLPIP